MLWVVQFITIAVMDVGPVTLFPSPIWALKGYIEGEKLQMWATKINTRLRTDASSFLVGLKFFTSRLMANCLGKWIRSVLQARMWIPVKYFCIVLHHFLSIFHGKGCNCAHLKVLFLLPNLKRHCLVRHMQHLPFYFSSVMCNKGQVLTSLLLKGNIHIYVLILRLNFLWMSQIGRQLLVSHLNIFLSEINRSLRCP